MRRLLRRGWLLLALTSLAASAQTNTFSQIIPEAASGFAATETVIADDWMAATNHPEATRAAAAILRSGGTAVDAAVAAQAMLGLVEPQSSGIGGGAFLLVWDASKQRLRVYDGRETAPAAVDSDHFLTDGGPMPFMDAVVGGHGVGVPGVLRMLELAHDRHGKLPWPMLFKPAIAMAEAGFALSPRLHSLLEQTPDVNRSPSLRSYFFDESGAPLPVGTLLRNPAYGDTLRRIATGGADAFYTGEIARDMVAAVAGADRPGKLALDDLANYRAIEREPVCSAFRAYRVCGAPPPSSGGTTTQAILGMLAQVEPDRLRPGSVDFIHHFAEASRLAFADRNTYVADPDFVSVPTAGLVDPIYLRDRARLIEPKQRLDSVTPGQPPTADPAAYRHRQAGSPEQISTSHVSIVDAAGNAVSMTTSIEMAFGAQLMVRGFLLNNQLTDFSFTPRTPAGTAVANRIEPGKRPRSSMAPTMVFREQKPVLLLGSPGGARIIDYVARPLYETLSGGRSLTEAIAAGHVVDLGFGLELEADRFSEETQAQLKALGHTVKELPQTSGLNGIRLEQGRLYGSVDPRREGTAVGE